MADIRALSSGGGGGGLSNAEYRVVKVQSSDKTSDTITVPNDIDFVIVFPIVFTYNGNTNHDLSNYSLETGVLVNVGDSVTFSEAFYSSNKYDCNQTITWINSTTITQTRSVASAAVQYMFCKYE